MKGRIITAALAADRAGRGGCGSSSSSSSYQQRCSEQRRQQRDQELRGHDRDRGPVHRPGRGPRPGAAGVRASSRSTWTTRRTARTSRWSRATPSSTPAQATTVTQQFISNSKIVAVVGPAGSQEVEAVGPLFGRAGMAFITGSATNPDADHHPARTRRSSAWSSRDDLQGPQDAHYIVNAPEAQAADDHRRPGGLLDRSGLGDDPGVQEGGHQGRPRVGQPEGHRLLVAGREGRPRRRPWSSCRGRSPPTPSSSARTSPSRRRRRRSSGPTVRSRSSFTIPGSYVSSFGPDINSIPADAVDRGGGEGRVPEVRDVRTAGVRRHARDRRGDRVGLQERTDAEPRQRAGGGQGAPARRRRSSVSRSSSTTTAT